MLLHLIGVFGSGFAVRGNISIRARGNSTGPSKTEGQQQNDYSVSLPAAESLSRSTAPAHRRESTEA